jgi:dTDP-4-amino-4,6-dideoxygalactose transaminase
MLEMQGAIGRIQLKRMADWTDRRTKNANAILNECSKYSALRIPLMVDHSGSTKHGYYKCYVYVNKEKLMPEWTRDRIIDEINAFGVPCYQGSCSEVYLEKAFDGTGFRPNSRLPAAKELGETAIMFLVHPTLTCDEVLKTCEAIEAVMSQASL